MDSRECLTVERLKLKQKDSLLSMYESNASGSRVHTNKTSRISENMKKPINPFMSGTP